MRRVLWGVLLVLALVSAAFAGYGVLSQVAVPAVRAHAPAAPQAVADNDVLAILEAATEKVYQEVSPSVVLIEVTEGATQSAPRTRRQSGQPFQFPPRQGSGSGFVWDKQGHIVTNNHVVDGATSIKVTFSDGATVTGKVVGTDPSSDLAVIQVSVPASGLQPVILADSTQVKVGQIAIAIGNPFGLENTMTVGHVSAVGRSLPVQSSARASYSIPDIIQTDAPINPGNSGGVLLDRRGNWSA